jgi:PAS domain S-box-containing protein
MTDAVWDKCNVANNSAIFPHDCWGGIWGQAMETQTVLYSNETGKVPEGHIGIDNMIAAPLVHAGKLVGCIALANTNLGYKECDISLMESIVSRISPLVSARIQRDDALESLREAAHRAETYLKLAPAIFVALDKDGYITLINNYGADLLGYSSDDCVGKNWFEDFIAEKDKEEVRSVFESLMQGTVLFSDYENTIITANGTERVIAWKNTVLKDNIGDITGTLSAGDDITEQRLAEKELERYWSAQERTLEDELNKLSLLKGEQSDERKR